MSEQNPNQHPITVEVPIISKDEEGNQLITVIIVGGFYDRGSDTCNLDYEAATTIHDIHETMNR